MPDNLFKDVIQDTEGSDEKFTLNQKSDRAGFRIESLQYEGGDEEIGRFDPEKFK
jgi:allophanate hydrolase subunit 2